MCYARVAAAIPLDTKLHKDYKRGETKKAAVKLQGSSENNLGDLLA